MRNALLAGVVVGGLLLSGCGSAQSAHTANPAVAPTAPAAPAAPTAIPAAAPSNAVQIDVTIAAGKVTTAQRLVDVPLGSPVLLVVTSDMADRVHVHGYDKEADLPAGQAVQVPFDATIPGVFEVELHHSGLQLLRLRVR